MTASKCSCNGAGSCAANDAPAKVYACAGASNVGKMSLDLAIALHEARAYNMSCR
jgi:uncharacterized metal-binding protein